MRGLPLPRPCHPRRAPACLASSGVPLAAPQARTPRAARPLPPLFPQCHSVVPSAPCTVVSNGEVLRLAHVPGPV